jgi:hypothetical protein
MTRLGQVAAKAAHASAGRGRAFGAGGNKKATGGSENTANDSAALAGSAPF